ncbi:uncharacterized protein LOC143774969 [Ranitomeya variabilis]|uniref:uncharacterized protein LOC143774969 n=1 Tax=Ranitomeya variabilis TaxID=490064 RepID=UPI0040568FF6
MDHSMDRVRLDNTVSGESLPQSPSQLALFMDGSDITFPSLSPSQQAFMHEFTLEEVEQAIADMATGKAPGPDGFPIELYRKYIDKLAPLLLKVLRGIWRGESVPETFYDANIIVLRKEGKDPLDCGSYRPISLVNVDYKIFTKILATRLNTIILDLIHLDQTGFMPGKSTSINIRRVQSVIQYSSLEPDNKWALASLDAAKAFDSLEWSFLSACLQRKPLDDRGRKKLEKLLNQSRQDIGQLTEQLLQTQEDLTLKDQKIKELQKQNELRVMEIHHVKSQMEVTKKSLQILQEETTIQCSLLEAEIRRQAEKVEVLESQNVLKGVHLTDNSTQCDIIDCMFRYNDVHITTNNQEEEPTVVDEEIPLMDEHNKLQDFTMELKSIYADSDLVDDMTKPESQESNSLSFPVIEQNTAAKSLNPEEDRASPVPTLSNMEENNSTSPHLPTNNKPPMTPPPALPTIQSDANILPGVDDCLDLDFQTSSVVSQEITPSSGSKLEPIILTHKNDVLAICQPNAEEVPVGSNVSFTLPNITIPDNETDEVNHVISSDERYMSPTSKATAQSVQDKNSVSIHLIPIERSNPIISLSPDEDTIPIKTTEDLYNTTAPECHQDAPRSISVAPPEKNTPARSVMSPQAKELNTLLSAQSSSVHSLKTYPITNMNINMEDQSLCTTSNSLPEIKNQATEATQEDVSAKEIEKGSIVSISTDSRHQSSELQTLSDRLLETECKGEAAKVETSDSGDDDTRLWWLSERLRKCVAEIRNLLNTEGFHSLADVLEEGIQDQSSEVLSTNLTQLENFPAVLQSLLHNIAKKRSEHEELRDGHSQDSVIRKASSLPLKHTEEQSQTRDELPMKTYLSYDFGHPSSLIFTRTDEEHNKRELQQACSQGRIPIDIYQDTSRMMSRYRVLCQERLRCLVWGYVQYISWNRAESLLKRQCLIRSETSPVLHKLQKRKDQAFLEWRDKLLKSQEQRLQLSAVLNQTLQGVHEDTGIFLIKPLISSSGRSVPEIHKEVNSKRPVQRAFSPTLCQGGISCHGISPNHVTKKWKYVHTHKELRPLVVTPKLLEMDVHRYLCHECCVMSQLRHSSPALLLRGSIQKNLVHVRRNVAFPALSEIERRGK